MEKTSVKTKILRVIWGLIPWVMVFAIVFFIFQLWGKIQVERSRLEEAKQEAIKKETPPVRVITLTAVPRRLEDKIRLPGYVEPAEDLWVKSEVSGQVIQILASEGQAIRKGQVLAQIDDRDYRTRLARIEANYKLAKLEYDRIYSLDQKRITAANMLDEMEARLADVAAQREEAKLALSRTRIVAPMDGQVNEIVAKQGDYYGIGDPVAQILRMSEVKVAVGIPESDAASFVKLSEASVIIAALEDRQMTGRKVFLSSQPRNLARLYDLELEIPNPNGDILPGMFASVELIRKAYNRALIVPLYAVINQGEEQFVYIENSGSAKKVQVEVGLLVDWQVHITSGLKPNDNVIVVGHRLLSEGQAVEVIKNVRNVQEILTL